mmetsp:Transcript_11136/g.36659  ORF Transcript_11136/g.36659 Transcript_11136/m.36659 type:complete len:287 (-) Transcript_11136:2620-3480(-)
MVLLHVKRADEQHQFLYETTVAANVGDVVREVVEINNLRCRIGRLKDEGGELAKYGPAKHPDKAGLEEGEDEEAPQYAKDPTGRRTGAAPDPKVAEMLVKTLADAHQYAHKDQVGRKVCLTKKALEEHVDTIRGAVMIAYPMGLPEWDPVREAIEDCEQLAGSAAGADVLEADNTQMWWASKALLPENKLSDHVGRNEKTKIVAKIQKKGGGVPQKEAPISKEEHAAMLAYYYKKQEEQKALVANEDDEYLHSDWASNKSLKGHFSGVGGVRMPVGSSDGFNGGMF